MSITNHAKALFEIAKEQKKTDVLTYHFEDFKHAMDVHPEWVKLMDSPMLTLPEKIKKIDALEYDVLFLSFLKMLATKNQMHLYKDVFHEWVHLSRIDQKIAHLHIYAAKPISDALEARLKQAIAPRFPNQTISFHITIDPDLIGGLKVVYQGQSLDRSVARELEELYTTI